MDKRTLVVDVHREPSGFWGEVRELEGCFAAGETLDEFLTALHESISLYVGEEEPERILTRLTRLELEVEPDLRSPDADAVSAPRARRKRQSHRDDWPPPRRPPGAGAGG